ncbi:MAG: YihY/virulence factor BrkB family protein [Planctomycetota bacterium]|jgi:membrane protein
MLSKIIDFLKTDIWRIRLKNYSRAKSFFIKQLRVIVLAVRGYGEDKCKFRASALTFFSLLSFVPVIAMMFGIAKGFGIQERVKAQILEKMEGQKEVAEKIIEFATSLLEKAQGGVIAGIGIIFLLWAVIKVLSNIENAFNDIWGIKKPRSMGRKFSDYLSLMLVCPILLVLAGSATVIISTKLEALITQLGLADAISSLILWTLELLPYCTLWLIFTFVFIFMPNTKVKFRSGLLAGIVTGTIFQIVQFIYIKFQVGVAKHGAIYGSFAALPLFLIWLQTSWLIVLFGAEISFAHQNVETYEFEPDCLAVSRSFKRLLSLLISNMLIKNFCKGQKALYAAQISQKLEIPIRLVRQILYELTESGVVSEVKNEDDKMVAYQPACGVETLTVKYVMDALDKRGNTDIPVVQSDELKKLRDCLTDFSDTVEKSPANTLLKNI